MSRPINSLCCFHLKARNTVRRYATWPLLRRIKDGYVRGIREEEEAVSLLLVITIKQIIDFQRPIIRWNKCVHSEDLQSTIQLNIQHPFLTNQSHLLKSFFLATIFTNQSHLLKSFFLATIFTKNRCGNIFLLKFKLFSQFC